MLKCLEEVKESFTSSLAYNTNQFAAAGYFMLGNLLKKYPNISNLDDIRNVFFQMEVNFLIL